MPPYDNLGDTILTLLSRVHIRLTPRDLVRQVGRKQPGVSRRSIRHAINTLVVKGLLIYTHHFGVSHLELNFRRPVQVSDRIVLLPAECRGEGISGKVVVRLLDGSAFGGGDHPTTRMVLRGLDAVLARPPASKPQKKMRALDIGTGSGILALAALKLGVATAVGIDIDPLACDAARKNAAINHLTHRLEISDHLPDKKQKGSFELILANLRPPTLKQLFPEFSTLSSPGAVWVLSGFRVEEQEDLKKCLPDVGFRQIWSSKESNWASWAIMLPDQSIRAEAGR